MARTSAQLLLSIAASMSLSGCVIPPDGLTPEVPGPYPPKIDLTQLIPSAPKTRVDLNCDEQYVLKADNVVDLDSDRLLFRWVANNDFDNTKWLGEQISEREPGKPHESVQPFEHGVDLRFDPNDLGIVFFSGVVSLFVTDAPEWAEPISGGTPGEKRNLGRIDDGGGLWSVVEARWTFEYVRGLGVCEQPN